jgi:glucosyl-3-phosphoglycerate synthase
MSDFHQNGVITTLHRLGPDNLDTLERDLEKTATLRPVLVFDAHEEGQAVEAFARAVRLASDNCLADPMGGPVIPSWNRVLAAMPDVFARLVTAVEKDNG